MLDTISTIDLFTDGLPELFSGEVTPPHWPRSTLPRTCQRQRPVHPARPSRHGRRRLPGGHAAQECPGVTKFSFHEIHRQRELRQPPRSCLHKPQDRPDRHIEIQVPCRLRWSSLKSTEIHSRSCHGRRAQQSTMGRPRRLDQYGFP